MHIKKLKYYSKLYRSSSNMGSARILRNYLQIASDFPIPLSIAHGVDFDQCQEALDIRSIEPIHWSCNDSIHAKALTIKPSVRLPHPWLMLKDTRPSQRGYGILVIGPPPSKANDEALLKCLKEIGIDTCDILLKYRGNIDLSKNFWMDNNYGVVSAGDNNDLFYDRLFDIIQKYEYVIGCTLSSALFFASALGKKCKIIENYFFISYEISNYLNFVNFSSEVGKNYTKLLKLNDHSEAENLAMHVLGDTFLKSPKILKEKLNAAIAVVKEPVYYNKTYRFLMKKILLHGSTLTGTSSLISFGFIGAINRKINFNVSLIKINEIDIWLNDLNNQNYQEKEIKFIKNVTIPGRAPVGNILFYDDQ